MNFLKIALRDISSIFKNRFIRVSVTAIIIVPLLYSLLYLYAFWDPYNRLTDMPVAVVNMDKGAIKDGQNVNYGNDFVDKLKDNKQVGWRFVSKDQAEKGVKDKGYYAMFVVPEDFSEKVLSAKNGKPEQPNIQYVANEKRNFLAAQINGKVMLELKQEIVKNITDEYTKVTFDNLYDLKDGMQKAADGSKELKDGIADAKDGTGELKDGTKKLNDNVPQLKDGVSKLYNGSVQLEDGINTAAVDSDGKPQGLKNGANQLKDGLQSAQAGVNQISGKLGSNKDLLSLLNPSNMSAVKNIMNDAGTLQNSMDANTFDALSQLSNPQTLGFMAKASQDVKDANLNAILQDPIFKSLSSVATPTNMAKMGKLLNDTDNLSKVDMAKLAPMTSLLGYSGQLNNLMNQAKTLSAMDMTKLAPMTSLLGYSTQLNGLMGQAKTLSSLDMSKLAPMTSLLGYSTQLNNLMNQAKTLSSMDMTSLNALAPMLQPNNASVVTGLLSTANNKFAGSNGQNIINFLNSQKANGTNFVTTAANYGLYDYSSGKAADMTQLEYKLKTKQALSDDEINKAIASLELVKSAAPNLASSAPVIDSMKNDITALKGTLDSNQTLIKGVQAGLNTNNLSNINSMLSQLQNAQTSMKSADSVNAMNAVQSALTPSNISTLNNMLTMLQSASAAMNSSDSAKAINAVQGALTQENIQNINTMLGSLQKAQAAMNTADSKNAMNAVQSTLTPDNVNYITATLQQLTNMKKDLDDNAANLQVVKGLMTKAGDHSLDPVIAKISVLQDDLNKGQTLVTALSSMDPKKLLNASQLMGQVSKLERELQDNQKLIVVAKNALNDGNIKMANDLVKAMPTLTDGINQLADGSKRLANGVSKLSDGAVQMKDGLSTLNSKVPELADGTRKLYDGSEKLFDGMVKLSDGSKELNDKLTDGSDKLNKNLINDSSTMGKYVSDPLNVEEKPVFSVKNYGTGFTPYFIPLSLWVGAIMMFFVITDEVDKDIVASSRSIVLGKFLSYGYIGLVQAVLASTVVLFLGLKPDNIVLYYLFNIFMSFVFIAIIQSLIFLLGMAGRLLSIVLLILQLTSCAGTFPLETVPKFFKVLNPFMPFTYCVSALREVISGVDYSVFSKDVTVLACIMVVFLVVSVLMKEHADRVKNIIKEKQEAINMG